MSLRKTRMAMPSTRISLASVFILIPYQREHAIHPLIDGLVTDVTVWRRWVGHRFGTTRFAIVDRTRPLEGRPDGVPHSLDLERIAPPVVLAACPHCLVDGQEECLVLCKVVVKGALSR